MTEPVHSLIDRLGRNGLASEDGGIGGLILAVIVVIAIIVVALIQWVF
jgi:hypothetical protein